MPSHAMQCNAIHPPAFRGAAGRSYGVRTRACVCGLQERPWRDAAAACSGRVAAQRSTVLSKKRWMGRRPKEHGGTGSGANDQWAPTLIASRLLPPLTRRRCARSIVERLFAMRSHCIIVANSGTSESCCSDQLTVGLFLRKRCSQTLPRGGRTHAFICTAGRSTRSTTGRRSHWPLRGQVRPRECGESR